MSIRDPYLDEYWSMVSDDYEIHWDGLFYIIDEDNGPYVLSAHNDEMKPSGYDGWSLQAFKNEILRIRSSHMEIDGELARIRESKKNEYTPDS